MKREIVWFPLQNYMAIKWNALRVRTTNDMKRKCNANKRTYIGFVLSASLSTKFILSILISMDSLVTCQLSNYRLVDGIVGVTKFYRTFQFFVNSIVSVFFVQLVNKVSTNIGRSLVASNNLLHRVLRSILSTVMVAAKKQLFTNCEV